MKSHHHEASLSKPIICLMGPTASGKSQLAIELATRFPFKLISVDSAMVYRGLDIGTAKPSVLELMKNPHSLIDICDLTEYYSAGRFRQDAINLISDIHRQNAIPLLVGGTMLYFSVLERGLSDLPQADVKIREQIALEAEKEGWPALHQKLEAIDPETAARIKPQDKQRLQRALEVYAITGQTLTQLHQFKQNLPFNIIKLAIAPLERQLLHHKIEHRLHSMFELGFINEVEQLFQRPELHADLPALRSVGYRQVWQHLSGEFDQKTLKERTLFATRQLAKRQLTWLRNWPNLVWFNSEDKQLLSLVMQYIMNHEKLNFFKESDPS